MSGKLNTVLVLAAAVASVATSEAHDGGPEGWMATGYGLETIELSAGAPRAVYEVHVSFEVDAAEYVATRGHVGVSGELHNQGTTASDLLIRLEAPDEQGSIEQSHGIDAGSSVELDFTQFWSGTCAECELVYLLSVELIDPAADADLVGDLSLSAYLQGDAPGGYQTLTVGITRVE
jgi:hypothetical protein